MDKETELGYRLRTGSLPSSFRKYMDPDDLDVPMPNESKIEFERRFSCQIGERCYTKYIRTLPGTRDPWVCGQCGE